MVSLNCRWKIPKTLPMNDLTEKAIGIDLGTTRCCCAVKRTQGIETVALENTGERLLPSYIGYDETIEKCGQIVISRLHHFHKSTVFDVKRIIGKKFKDIQNFIDPNWTFSVESDSEGNVLIITEHGGKELSLSPIEPSATLLNQIKTKAEEFQGKSLENVVITVPAIFTDLQCKDTILAGFLAQFSSIRLLPEPIAAAFSYFIDKPFPNYSTLLLFDLGGGTLDICIFKIINDEIQIISNDGDSKLGGRDFDNILFEYFKRKMEIELNVKNVEKKKYKLLSKCQEIKVNLSVCDDDGFDVSDIDPEKDEYIKITRGEFENLSFDLLERINIKINMALNNGDTVIRQNDINEILLVGGGSRMPMIKMLLKSFFPYANQRSEIHPDEVVAKGAAYFACYLLSNPELSNQWITEGQFKDETTINKNFRMASLDSDSEPLENTDDYFITVEQGPDEIVSNRTMKSILIITGDGRIEGTTTLIAKHWIWGFKGGVQVNIYDEAMNLLWQSEWHILGTNMYSNSIRHWTDQIPIELVPHVEKVIIVHKNMYEIE